jgi:hypothetical protein
MSRRAQKPELEFGSDSFLDVVCNIVGILIILIVVVAVKVERQPKGGAEPASSQEALAASAAARAESEHLLAEREQSLAGLRAADHELSGALESLQAERSAAEELTAQLRKDQERMLKKQELENTRSSRRQLETTELNSEKRSVAARLASLQRAVDERQQAVQALSAELTSVSTAEQALDKKIESVIVETLRLNEVLEQTQEAAAPKERLEHRLSPVTKPVETAELHFRVEHGRVSQIPLEELLERLKAQVMARRSAVMRFHQVDGTVGPVLGYRMTYTVEREGPSALEALQSGDGRTRISVSKWTITPDPGLIEESIEEAARPGSDYRQVVETAAPDTVVTMWIYPDSFTSFSVLREIAHGMQLRVAARPLPADTPIVGSPNGSRSTAQ